jgi:hypothetical protein
MGYYAVIQPLLDNLALPLDKIREIILQNYGEKWKNISMHLFRASFLRS